MTSQRPAQTIAAIRAAIERNATDAAQPHSVSLKAGAFRVTFQVHENATVTRDITRLGHSLPVRVQRDLTPAECAALVAYLQDTNDAESFRSIMAIDINDMRGLRSGHALGPWISECGYELLLAQSAYMRGTFVPFSPGRDLTS